jgi:predicted nucleic acid-binding protein
LTRYLLDTDWIIDCLSGEQGAIDILLELAPSGLATSVITYAELYEGVAASRRRAEDLERLEDFMAAVEILGIDLGVVRIFGERRAQLRAKGLLIDNFDLLIAATALRFDLVLLTRNVNDFQRIEGLHVYGA